MNTTKFPVPISSPEPNAALAVYATPSTGSESTTAASWAVRGPSSWIWIRPGEKRSCIGCHEDPELAPENKVPDALYAGLISLPDGTRTEAIVLNGKIKGNDE